MGSNAFSSSWPASAAIVIVTSFPIILKATWLTTSGITGLTLPGIIDEPFCLAGRLISPNPALGPDDINRRSLAILDKVTAQAFTAPDTATKGSRFCVASIRSYACTNSISETSTRLGTILLRYASSALIPVPTAVPPILRVHISSIALSIRWISRITATEYALNS